MKQLLQDLRSFDVQAEEVTPPCCLPGRVLIRYTALVISRGVGRAATKLGNSTLLCKAPAGPDLDRQLFLLDERHRDKLRAFVGAAVRGRELPTPFEGPRAMTLDADHVRESLSCVRSLQVLSPNAD